MGRSFKKRFFASVRAPPYPALRQLRQVAGRDRGKQVMLDVPEHIERHGVLDTAAQRAREIMGAIAVMVNGPDGEERGDAVAAAIAVM